MSEVSQTLRFLTLRFSPNIKCRDFVPYNYPYHNTTWFWACRRQQYPISTANEDLTVGECSHEHLCISCVGHHSMPRVGPSPLFGGKWASRNCDLGAEKYHLFKKQHIFGTSSLSDRTRRQLTPFFDVSWRPDFFLRVVYGWSQLSSIIWSLGNPCQPCQPPLNVDTVRQVASERLATCAFPSWCLGVVRRLFWKWWVKANGEG